MPSFPSHTYLSLSLNIVNLLLCVYVYVFQLYIAATNTYAYASKISKSILCSINYENELQIAAFLTKTLVFLGWVNAHVHTHYNLHTHI